MEYQNLIFKVENKIATVTINRPEKLNALNNKTIEELGILFKKIKDDDSIKVIVITGTGEKAFVAGADISELNSLNAIAGKRFSEKGQAVFNQIENLGKPVIAAVNGFALGGGCELALACHIRLASSNAMFGQPEVNLGIIPGYGGTQRLARLINPGRAAEYILTGDMINAEEALRIGLVNKVFEQNELLPNAYKVAEKIISKGQIALQMALKAVVSSSELNLNEGLKMESGLFALTTSTEDFKEGTKAFLEKRRPEFKGE